MPKPSLFPAFKYVTADGFIKVDYDLALRRRYKSITQQAFVHGKYSLIRKLSMKVGAIIIAHDSPAVTVSSKVEVHAIKTCN